MTSRLTRQRNTFGRMMHPAVHGQRHEQRRRQGSLGDELADRRRDRHGQRLPAPRPGIEGQDVEDQQAPGDADPAPHPALARSGAELRAAPARPRAGGGSQRRASSSAMTPQTRGPDRWAGLAGRESATPRLSSVLSAPMRTADTRRQPGEPHHLARRRGSWSHDDCPAVTMATASVAQVARCSAPSEGSRVARVSSRSAEA